MSGGLHRFMHLSPTVCCVGQMNCQFLQKASEFVLVFCLRFWRFLHTCSSWTRVSRDSCFRVPVAAILHLYIYYSQLEYCHWLVHKKRQMFVLRQHLALIFFFSCSDTDSCSYAVSVLCNADKLGFFVLFCFQIQRNLFISGRRGCCWWSLS